MNIVEPAFTILYPQTKTEALDALRRVKLAGRVCYKSEDRVTDESYHRFIQMLMQRGHYCESARVASHFFNALCRERSSAHSPVNETRLAADD